MTVIVDIAMTTPIDDLVRDLRGVLFGENVLLDAEDLVGDLGDKLYPKITDETTASDVTDLLCKFFLPPIVLDEMGNSGDFARTLEESVIEVVTPLLPALKAVAVNHREWIAHR